MEDFGQKIDLTSRIREVLRDYSVSVGPSCLPAFLPSLGFTVRSLSSVQVHTHAHPLLRGIWHRGNALPRAPHSWAGQNRINTPVSRQTKHTHTHTHTDGRTHTHIHTRTQTHTQKHTQKHTHTYTHTLTHTHTHTLNTNMLSLSLTHVYMCELLRP